MAKPAKNFDAVVATANDLTSGAVVYRKADGAWSTFVSDAFVARSKEEAEALLQDGMADVAQNRVVEIVLIEVDFTADGKPVPRTLRERIRAAGPSVAYRQPEAAKAVA